MAHGLRGRRQSPEHVAKRAAALRRTVENTVRRCARCGDEFTLTGPNQKYCSGRCWNAESRPKKRKRSDRKISDGEARDAYARLLYEQGPHCAVCRTPGGTTGYGRLAVDHDHATGRIRGLLCHRCNTALGLLKDDATSLRAAIAYLEGISI